MALTKVTYSMIDGPQVNAADFGGFTATSTASQNIAALNAAKAAVVATGNISTPIYIPAGEFNIDNTTPFEMVSGLVIRGTAIVGQEDRGTIFNLTQAQPMFQATGDYVSDWELSGITIDYKNVTNSQTTNTCVGVKISGGSVQGASRFFINNVTVNKPYIGFADLSTVSFGYIVQNFQVILPGDKGFSIDGSGTTKTFINPLINGYVAGGNNDGFYINGQTGGVTIRNSVFDSLAGRHIYAVNSNVYVDDCYVEPASTNANSSYFIFDACTVTFNRLNFYVPRLNVDGASVFLIQTTSKVLLESIALRGGANVGSGTVYNLRLDTPDATTEVTVINSPSIKVPPTIYAGAGSIGIYDLTSRVKLVENSKRIYTPVTQVGGSEKILMTTTVNANTLNNGGAIRVTANGIWTGNNGTKALIFYFGTKAIILFSGLTTTANWSVEVIIQSSGSYAAQKYYWKAWDGTTMYEGYDTATIDTNADQTLKLTENAASASDSCTQNLMIVETL
jgi:hypothetical protein